MSSVSQWPLRRPRWAAVTGMLMIAGASLCLAYCVSWPYAACFLLAGAGCSIHYETSLASYPHAARLHWEGGQWRLESGSTRRCLSLTRAWPGFGWLTLQFRDAAADNSKEAMLELTIWKSCVAPAAWRTLRVQVARQTATGGSMAARGAQ